MKIKKTYGLKRERVMRLFHTKHNTQKKSTWEEQGSVALMRRPLLVL